MQVQSEIKNWSQFLFLFFHDFHLISIGPYPPALTAIMGIVLIVWEKLMNTAALIEYSPLPDPRVNVVVSPSCCASLSPQQRTRRFANKAHTPPPPAICVAGIVSENSMNLATFSGCESIPTLAPSSRPSRPPAASPQQRMRPWENSAKEMN